MAEKTKYGYYIKASSLLLDFLMNAIINLYHSHLFFYGNLITINWKTEKEMDLNATAIR